MPLPLPYRYLTWQTIALHAFALVVCRHPDGRFLLVQVTSFPLRFRYHYSALLCSMFGLIT